MTRDTLEAYGARARILADTYIASGRLPKDRAKFPATIDDVVAKLELVWADRVLDIGCGVGDMLMGYHWRVSAVTGVDHPDCVARLRDRLPHEDRIRLIGGDWLDVELKESFSKILVYDAIHYLSTAEEFERFVFKAAKLLEAGGKMLIGNLPSVGKRGRFDRGIHGRAYNIAWNEAMDAGSHDYNVLVEPTEAEAALIRRKDLQVVKIDDALLLGLLAKLRAAELDAWLVPQSTALSFHVQREDLIIGRP